MTPCKRVTIVTKHATQVKDDEGPERCAVIFSIERQASFPPPPSTPRHGSPSFKPRNTDLVELSNGVALVAAVGEFLFLLLLLLFLLLHLLLQLVAQDPVELLHVVLHENIGT